MYHYHAYGLTISSALPLPELLPARNSSIDVAISLEPISWCPKQLNHGGAAFECNGSEAFFYWEAVGTFVARNGRQIVVDPRPEVDPQLIRLPLLGAVIATLLHQRGQLVLHGSAVQVSDSAVIFLASKGGGKSTLAGALYRQGYPLLTDDVVALDMERVSGPVVAPGFPQLKLWPDAAAALGDDPDCLTPIIGGVEKRIRRVDERIASRPVDTAGLVVLSFGAEVRLQRLAPPQALLHLLSNSYASRFGQHLLHGLAAAKHLQDCATLLKTVPMYILERPRSLTLLPQIVDLLALQLQPQRLRERCGGISPAREGSEHG